MSDKKPLDLSKADLSPQNLLLAAHALQQFFKAAEHLHDVCDAVMMGGDPSKFDHLEGIVQENAATVGMQSTIDITEIVEEDDAKVALYASMMLPDTVAHIMQPFYQKCFLGKDAEMPPKILGAHKKNIFWMTQFATHDADVADTDSGED